MPNLAFIFPNQLFEQNPLLNSNNSIYLIEEYLFFKQFRFHKQKLVLHRASMKYYMNVVQKSGLAVNYVNAFEKLSDVRELLNYLAPSTIEIIDVVDDWLKRRINKAAKLKGHSIKWLPSPNFLGTMDDYKDFIEPTKKLFQTDFYIKQRKKMGVLMQPNGMPVGGKWSFDSENRAKYPRGKPLPTIAAAEQNEFVVEAKNYVNEYFFNNYGACNSFIYPVSHAAAKAWLLTFLEQRFKDFGQFEDAILSKETFLHHSLLSPIINTGLLSPQYIIEAVISYASAKGIPLNSQEGFLRQIIGWREFIRVVYELKGRQQRTCNYWNFTRKIPKQFWEGNTGILPIDDVIEKNKTTGYNHHIERLMIMGNFMLLCEFDPNEVYLWFMEMYVDAYDWVMVPNVYGMTQFADGGLMTTKPYISGSNYIIKMSDYKKGAWSDVWDALFWRFMHVHRDFFLKNPRLGMLVKTFDKMKPEKQSELLDRANNYLKTIDDENC